MQILQKSFLWVIIFGFLGIIGYEMYGRYNEMVIVRKAKHNQLIKKLEKEEE